MKKVKRVDLRFEEIEMGNKRLQTFTIPKVKYQNVSAKAFAPDSFKVISKSYETITVRDKESRIQEYAVCWEDLQKNIELLEVLIKYTKNKSRQNELREKRHMKGLKTMSPKTYKKLKEKIGEVIPEIEIDPYHPF